MTEQNTLPTTPFDPARLARLSRGLLMILRSLSSRSGGEDDVTVSKKLAIQRFYKEFEAWIRELEQTPIQTASSSNSSKSDIPIILETPEH